MKANQVSLSIRFVLYSKSNFLLSNKLNSNYNKVALYLTICFLSTGTASVVKESRPNSGLL